MPVAVGFYLLVDHFGALVTEELLAFLAFEGAAAFVAVGADSHWEQDVLVNQFQAFQQQLSLDPNIRYIKNPPDPICTFLLYKLILTKRIKIS